MNAQGLQGGAFGMRISSINKVSFSTKKKSYLIY